MGYRLKSGLSKTVVYEAIKAFNSTGVEIPRLGACAFRKHRNSYWLSFSDENYGYEVYFCVFAGFARICFTRMEYDPRTGETYHSDLPKDVVPFDYLLSHGMLREVA